MHQAELVDVGDAGRNFPENGFDNILTQKAGRLAVLALATELALGAVALDVVEEALAVTELDYQVYVRLCVNHFKQLHEVWVV